MTRRDIKDLSKDALRGRWLTESAIVFLMIVITGFITAIFNPISSESLIGTFVATVLTIPFTLAYTNHVLKISRKQEDSVVDSFKEVLNVDLLIKAFVISLVAQILITLGFLFLIVPGIIVAIMFSQTDYLLLDFRDKQFGEILTLSKELMKGHKAEYFVLGLSFFGWSILAGMTIIGLLPLIVYTSVTFSVYHDYLARELQIR